MTVARVYMIDRGGSSIQVSPLAQDASPGIRGSQVGFKSPALPGIILKGQAALVNHSGWHFINGAWKLTGS